VHALGARLQVSTLIRRQFGDAAARIQCRCDAPVGSVLLRPVVCRGGAESGQCHTQFTVRAAQLRGLRLQQRAVRVAIVVRIVLPFLAEFGQRAEQDAHLVSQDIALGDGQQAAHGFHRGIERAVGNAQVQVESVVDAAFGQRPGRGRPRILDLLADRRAMRVE